MTDQPSPTDRPTADGTPPLPENPEEIEPGRQYHHRGLRVRFRPAWHAIFDFPYQTDQTAADYDIGELATRVRRYQDAHIQRAEEQGDNHPWPGPPWLRDFTRQDEDDITEDHHEPGGEEPA